MDGILYIMSHPSHTSPYLTSEGDLRSAHHSSGGSLIHPSLVPTRGSEHGPLCPGLHSAPSTLPGAATPPLAPPSIKSSIHQNPSIKSQPRSPRPASGLVASSIVDAREGIHEWVRKEIEDVVGDKRVAAVRHDIDTLTTKIIAGFLAEDDTSKPLVYPLFVKLLGGRKASKKGAAKASMGAWGSTAEEHYAQDVPTAATHLDRILTAIYVDTFGCDKSPQGGIGLAAMAREAAAALNAANMQSLIVDYFSRLALATERMRTRRVVDPSTSSATLSLPVRSAPLPI